MVSELVLIALYGAIEKADPLLSVDVADPCANCTRLIICLKGFVLEGAADSASVSVIVVLAILLIFRSSFLLAKDAKVICTLSPIAKPVVLFTVKTVALVTVLIVVLKQFPEDVPKVEVITTEDPDLVHEVGATLASSPAKVVVLSGTSKLVLNPQYPGFNTGVLLPAICLAISSKSVLLAVIMPGIPDFNKFIPINSIRPEGKFFTINFIRICSLTFWQIFTISINAIKPINPSCR
jgi:hypothetical protein